MKPVELLMNEHRLIEKALDSLDVFSAHVSQKETKGEKEELAKFVEFIREFADRAHHGKEEDILFAEMEKGGFPRDGGPLAVMLSEHDEGRKHVRILANLANAIGSWTKEDRRKLGAAATAYTSLLRQHILKEDQVLYPMALANLPSGCWNGIEKAFAEFEAKEGRRAETERLAGLATELTSKWPGRCSTKPKGSSCGCCG